MLKRDEDVSIYCHEDHGKCANAYVAVEYEWKYLT